MPEPFFDCAIPPNLGLLVWEDIRYIAIFTECEVAPEHVVEVKVYELLGIETLQKPGRILFQDGNVSRDRYSTTAMSEAEVFMEGDIKWDGCSNWSFYPADNCAIHFCGADDAAKLGELFKRLYEEAEHLIPAWA